MRDQLLHVLHSVLTSLTTGVVSYQLLKYLHIALVSVSATGFVLRGILVLCRAPVMRARWMRVIPHVVDTALLLSGVAMLISTHWSLMHMPWMHTKLTLLAVYVVLGALALRGKRPVLRLAAFMGAVMCLAWMAVMAVSKSPLGFFAS